MTDSIFECDRFDELPVRFIFETIEQVTKHRRQEANAAAGPTLYLLGAVRSVAGSKKDIDLRQFLPYPPTDNRLSDRTATVIGQLMDEERIPTHVIAAMGKFLDDIPES